MNDACRLHVAALFIASCTHAAENPSADAETGAETTSNPTVSTGVLDGGLSGTTGGLPTGATTEGTTSGTTDAAGTEPRFDIGANADVSVDLPEIPATCDAADVAQTTVGCRFFGADLDQNGMEDEQYAIAVSNPQPTGTATVTIEHNSGGVWSEVDSATIDPLELYVFPLADLHQNYSGINVGGSYRVTADVPVVAYQFNPLMMDSFSSDASLLYPVSSWDTTHRALHWGAGPASAYLSVVAAYDDTVIEITATSAISDGPGVPGTAAGTPLQISLNEGDLVEVAAASDGSMAGTLVESLDPTKPVAVFSGHACAWIPNGVAACDHLEEQLPGVRLWGNHFVGARMPVREVAGEPETTLWQVVASEDNTTVTLSAHPEVSGLPASPLVLQAGEHAEFYVAGTTAHPGDIHIDADHPIAVGNFMTGSLNLTGGGFGDPAFVHLSPIEQYLRRYVVLVATGWDTDIFVITRPTGSTVTIDDEAVDDGAFIPVGDGFEVARVATTDGVHVIAGTQPIMASVVGYATTDAYAYLSGAGTAVINPSPAG